MDGSTFYIVGGALVLAAFAISAVGIRGREGFPKSKSQMAGILALFALLVAGTSAFAVAYAREEQDHREHELAQDEAEAESGVAEQEGSADAGAAPAAQEAEGQASEGGEPSGEPAAGQTLDVTSPEDGSLAFEPDALSADAGTVTLAYDNPSPVTHNIAIEDEQSQLLAESEDVIDGAAEATAPLVPGQYLYYCTIPGHREGGMEGTLEVQ